MLKEIKLRIVLQNPADDTVYGLQKGKSPACEIVQAQLGNGQDLVFDFSVQLKKANASPPTLAGPFVQGPAKNRFVYLAIGHYAGQTPAPWSGRLKVPLPASGFQLPLSDDGISFWSCTVPGSREGGKPVFATVKPFGGWFKQSPAGQDRT